MGITRASQARPRAAKRSGKLAETLRGQILSGKISSGAFLPTMRELSDRTGHAPRTVLRALKALQSEGLVAAEPRQGYRVLARANDPARGHPVAYVLSVGDASQDFDELHTEILAALQRAAGRRGWPLVTVTAETGGGAAAAVRQLRELGASGAVLDSARPELLAMIRETGLPAIMVDSWHEQAALDAVLQDNYNGGALAASYLIDRGHRRIGWFGAIGASYHTRARFGGALAALTSAGLRPPDRLVADSSPAGDATVARKLLSGRDRPTAVLALSRYLAPPLVQAARDLGLGPDETPEIVSWSPEELYERHFKPWFGGGAVPAAMVWSIDTMAETALRRLEDRRANPNLPAIQMTVPARLRPQAEGRIKP